MAEGPKDDRKGFGRRRVRTNSSTWPTVMKDEVERAATLLEETRKRGGQALLEAPSEAGSRGILRTYELPALSRFAKESRKQRQVSVTVRPSRSSGLPEEGFFSLAVFSRALPALLASPSLLAGSGLISIETAVNSWLAYRANSV